MSTAKAHQNVSELRSTPIVDLLKKYYWPAFTGAIINTLYNIVDRIFIGQGVGAEALAGLTSVFPIMLILMAFGMLVGMGGSVRVSYNLGKNNSKRAEMVLGNAAMLCIVFSLVLSVGAFLTKDSLLAIFGVSDTTLGYANEYLNIILIGAVFNITGFSLNNIIRAEGNAKIAMYSMLLSAGVNLILDPIFIFALDMGVAGAAWATVISQIVLFIWVISHFKGKKSLVKLSRRNFKPNKEIIIYIITVGFAPFAMQLAASVVQGTANTQLIRYGGDLAVGGMGVIMSVAMMILMAVFSLNMAAQPIISFNNGAKDYRRVKETLLLCVKIATIIATAGGLMVELFPDTITQLFNSDNDEFVRITRRGMRIVMLMCPIIGLQIVTSNYFQAIGNAKISAMLSLLRQVIALIPILLILPGILGLDGVWLAFPMADLLAGVASSFMLIREVKRLNRKIAEMPAEI